MLLPDELDAIAEWCEARGVRLISDEIYHGIDYGYLGGQSGRRSAWHTSRSAIVFGSFSKYFSMTGWRLGWMLVPEDLRRPVDVLTGNFTICPPVLSQHAAIAAFTPESYAELDGHVARYAANREQLLVGLAAHRHPPAGACRRSLLRLRRHQPPHRRLLRLVPAAARGDRRGHRPGHRLRHPARQPVRADVLRRLARRRSSRASSASGRGCTERGLRPVRSRFQDDPYPAYAWLREHDPVHHHAKSQAPAYWALTRFADVWDAVRGPRTSPPRRD